VVRHVSAPETIDGLTRTAAFPYADYLAWDAVVPPLFLLSTSLVELRPRSEWNTRGRERYDRAVVVRHAEGVLAALPERLCRGRWLVRHAGKARRWLPGPVPRLRSFMEAQGVADHPGAFVLDGELATWLPQLIDDPFLRKSAEVELVGLDEPWLLLVTHHLDVQLVTRDREALDRIAAAVAAVGIRTRTVTSPGVSARP
jgi:hypothetical protein